MSQTRVVAASRGVSAETAAAVLLRRIFFACVLLFAGWVAVWGLFLPGRIVDALPFAVPPLHARFLGVMYLSGAVFLALGIAARSWSEVRVMTTMLWIWTGMLGLVSLVHVRAFDWSRVQVWFWFFAYIVFPLVALWITWQRRGDTVASAGRGISAGFSRYLVVQGFAATALGLALFVAPQIVAPLWPWKIPVLLAQIYSAPFLSYGIGSVYAARQRAWRDVRIVVAGTLVFTLGVICVSLIHASLFDPHRFATWLWFGAFGIASAVLLRQFLAGFAPKDRAEPH